MHSLVLSGQISMEHVMYCHHRRTRYTESLRHYMVCLRIGKCEVCTPAQQAAEEKYEATHTSACSAAQLCSLTGRQLASYRNEWNGLAVTAVAIMLSLKPRVTGSHFTLFCSCDLDLDLLTFIYELDLYSPRCTCRPKKNFLGEDCWKLLYWLGVAFAAPVPSDNRCCLADSYTGTRACGEGRKGSWLCRTHRAVVGMIRNTWRGSQHQGGGRGPTRSLEGDAVCRIIIIWYIHTLRGYHKHYHTALQAVNILRTFCHEVTISEAAKIMGYRRHHRTLVHVQEINLTVRLYVRYMAQHTKSTYFDICCVK